MAILTINTENHYLCLTNYSKSTMEFIIILLLLILNGIFAMYEIALVSSSKARLETLVGKENKRAKGVLKQLEEPENSSPPSKSVLLLSVSYPVPMVVPPSLMT